MTRVRAGRLLRLQSACAAELDDILRRSAGGRVILVNHLPAELDGLVVSREAAQRGLPVGIEHHTGRPRGRELLFARQRRLARPAGAVAPLGLEPLLGPDPVDLGNGIDTVFFDRRRASPPGTFRARHPALAGDRRLLVAPGHIATRKRQLDLLEAAQTLRSGLGVNDFVLVLPGAVREPAYRERLLAYRQRHGLAGHVLLLDHLDPTELRDAYADSDLGLLASEFEGRPRVVLEMGAMAVPVVATDLPGIRDCLLPGESGLLVPVADPRSLAAAVAGLLRDPDRREAFGRAGASFVRERHSLPALADRHVAFYLEILHGGATTAPRSGRALC